MFEDIVDGFDEDDADLLFDLVWDVRGVLAIGVGDEDGGDACAEGGEGFFLEAADGEDRAAEADFAGHGEVVADGFAGVETCEGGEHGDACAGAVFGDGTCGDVDVDIVLAEGAAGDAEGVGAAADETHGGLDGFLHDIAELAGELDGAFAGVAEGFDVEDIAADGSPCEAGDDAGAGDVEFFVVDEAGRAEDDGGFVRGDGDGSVRVDGDLGGDGAADRGELAFEVADPGFARVVGDEGVDGFGGDLEVSGFEPVFAALTRQEVAGGDGLFLAGGVGAEFDDFEPVAEGVGDGVGAVGGGDEEDRGEVEGDVEVVVGERVVLGWVEDLEERGGGIAAEVAAEFIDFVEEDDWVASAGAADFGDEAAGHGTDVGAAVAADVGFVANAAEADAREVAAEGLGDALAETGFADAGRAEEEEDGAAAFGVELADREGLDEPAFDFFEAEVVVVEDLAGVDEIKIVLGGDAPWEGGEGFEVGEDDGAFRAALGDVIEAFEFAVGLFAGGGGELGGVESGAEFAEFVGGFLIAFAEFFFDGFLLFAEPCAALHFAELGLDVLLDFILEFCDLDL